MIVFGHNSFMLNECKPSQLGLPASLDTDFNIERRQRYAHLFWIPVFGIGKIWALRKRSDNKLYVPGAALEHALDSLPLEHRTPWYTYSFLLLVLGAGVIFYVQNIISEYHYSERNKEYKAEKIQYFTASINTPKAAQYYEMEAQQGHVYLKVLANNVHALQCVYSYKQDPHYSEYKILEAFVADSVNQTFDTISINKADLLKTINVMDAYPFEGYEVIPGAGKFTLYESTNFPNPVFKNLSAGYEEGKFFAVLQNIGEGALLASMETEPSNTVLQTPTFPAVFDHGQVIYLRGSYNDSEPRLNSKVNFQTQAKDIIEYALSIHSLHVSFKPSEK